jgi:hypothetical protein
LKSPFTVCPVTITTIIHFIRLRLIFFKKKLSSLLLLLTIPQIFTQARGPLAASVHEVGAAQVRVLIGCVFVEIVTESETYHICRAVLLII